jgi:hypothetical protein
MRCLFKYKIDIYDLIKMHASLEFLCDVINL